MKLAAALILFAAVNAFAFTDEPTSTSSENLVNLNYYPHIGHFEFASNLFTSLHSQSGSSNESFNGFELFGSYGLPVEGLRITASINDEITSYDSAGSTFSYSGVTDPSFSLVYRAFDNSTHGLSLDVELLFSPDFGTNYYSDSGASGSNHKGYSELGLSSTLFWTQSINEASLEGGILREFDGSDHSPILDTENDRGSLWVGNVEFTDRVHLCPRFFVEGEANFQLDYSVGWSTGTVYQTPFHVIPTFEVGYLHSKQLLLKGYLRWDRYTQNVIFSDASSADSLHYSASGGFVAQIEF